MKVTIGKRVNLRIPLIPKPILARLEQEGNADVQVRDGVVEIPPLWRNPREGWAEDAKRVAAAAEDVLVWPEVGTVSDVDLVW